MAVIYKKNTKYYAKNPAADYLKGVSDKQGEKTSARVGGRSQGAS